MRNLVVDDQSNARKVVAVMAQARAADPHHGRTFILDVGAIGRPGPRVQAVMTWDIRPS